MVVPANPTQHGGQATPHPTVIQPPRIIRARPPAGERGQTKSLTYAGKRYLGDPNPERITSQIVHDMEKDPQVRAGILVRELAILGKPGRFNYTPTNPEDPIETALGKRMVAFLEHVWANLTPDPNRILRNILSARRFGFSVNELVWRSHIGPDGSPQLSLIETGEWAGFATVDRIKYLPSSSFETGGFASDEFGNLRAAHQNLSRVTRAEDVPGVIIAPEADTKTRYNRITFDGNDLERLIIYVANPKDGGDFYGISDHKSAYQRWYSKQAALSGLDILLERQAGVVVGEYSTDLEQDGLASALDQTAAGAVLTVPKESNVRLLEGAHQQVAAFHEAIRYADIQILRAYLVPHESVGGSDQETGSFARSASHAESFLMTLAQIQTELEEVVETQFIQRLIDANFGKQNTYPTFDFPDPADKDIERLSRIYQLAIQDGYVDPEIDAAWMRSELDFPPAPTGHSFQKPTPEPMPFAGGQFGGGAFGGPKLDQPNRPHMADPRLSAARPDDDELSPSLFESVENTSANEHTVTSLELSLEADLSRLLATLRESILTHPPESAEDADKIRINPADFQKLLDAAAERVLETVRADLTRKFRQLGNTDAANSLLNASQPRGFLARLLAATPNDGSPLDAIQSYKAWSEALNKAQAEGQAALLQTALRVRVVQAYSAGLTPVEVVNSIADEFATYTANQLKTVTKTTVFDYYNSARNAAFDAAGDYVQGVKLVPLLDRATTPFCRDLVGRSISKSDPNYEKMRSAPFWYNCRTTVVPILRDERGHVFDTDWDAWIQSHRDAEGGGFLYGRS